MKKLTISCSLILVFAALTGCGTTTTTTTEETTTRSVVAPTVPTTQTQTVRTVY